MRQLILTTLLLGMTATAAAQESHYQRALRGQDTDYGLVVDPPLSGVGMYWSRTRNVDDVAIVNEGAAEGGTMMYMVNATQPASTDGFSATVPTAEGLTAGTYYVWYYVKADDSHTDSEISASGIEVTIAAAAPTLAETMTTAGMTVKVNFNYEDDNYCSFLSNGNGTYTFQSGGGYAGRDDDCAKALVVEGGKLVFKQNVYDTIDDFWDSYGFSVTFDTSDNTYSQWVGEAAAGLHNPSFISVEVNGTQIAVTAAQ